MVAQDGGRNPALGSDPRDTRADKLQAVYSARVMNCPDHRLTVMSSEVFWATPRGYGDPVRTEYTYRCPRCGAGYVLVTYEDGRRSETKPIEQNEKARRRD